MEFFKSLASERAENVIMADEKWQKVRDIFEAARQLKPTERQEYIKSACGGDAAIYSEVESLLSNSYDSDTFLKHPPVGEVADLIVEEREDKVFSKGQQISHYRIVKPIGKGGMGEVYLAKDTKLNRTIAIKFLTGELSKDGDKINRFIREAQAASALNHPNIITVYEIGQTDQTQYIATEFIDGKTLTDTLDTNILNLGSVLDIATQIGSALDEAHTAGIIHRDIKPDNVMIRPDGLVKVLDFGIAKLAERSPFQAESDDDTAIRIKTTPGMIIGTANYMSPEQARGRGVDHRTDIFSFGVVLYKMLSGDLPFSGDTMSDILAAILTKDPNPLESIPPELSRIVEKSLKKDKKKRYQTAKDLLNDLKECKLELEIQSRLEGTPSRNLKDQKTQMLSPPHSTGNTTDSEAGFRVEVLPFKYRSSSIELKALAEGFSEEIITGLSKFSYLRVIAHGQKVGAQYFIEGSIRQAGATLRVAVKLVDTEFGQHLWAETFDRSFEPENIFAFHDELVPIIVSTVADLHGVLPHAISESLRSRDPKSLTTYESVLRTFGYMERLSEVEHAEVRNILERATDADAENADCQAMLSYIYAEEYKHGFNLRPNPLDRALDAARRATTSAPSNHLAHHMLAQALFFRREIKSFRISAERAVALNPMDGDTIAFMGILLSYAGDWERGCALAEKAMLLNPLHPGWYRFAAFNNAFRKGDHKVALDVAIKFNMPSYFYTHIAVAAVNGHIGDSSAAQRALDELLELKPDFKETALVEMGKWFVDPTLFEEYVEGLQKAGLDIRSTKLK